MSGKLFLIIGPSGVGKGVLIDALRQAHPEFYFPPSATTRQARAGESEGEQYHFMTAAEFENLEQQSGFLETATIHGTEKYGTLKQPILEAIESGKVVIREVDVQGLASIREGLAPEKFESIFIAPPNLEILKKRILRRQPEISAGELARRLKSAEEETAQKDLTDYEVISEEGQIPKMVSEVEGIITKETGE
ncbi:MAG: guanylate kinase [Patescibacteria group bacterium]